MAHDASGKYIGLGVGDSNADTALINYKLHEKYQWARDLGVTNTQPYTQTTATAIGSFCSRVGIPAVADAQGAPVATLAIRQRLGAAAPPPPPEPVCVVFSINGAGSTWNMGYPFDIGETLDKSRCWHQPIGYNTAPFPMSKGVADGVAELIRQLDMPRGRHGLTCASLPWAMVIYSMGAIVGMTVLMRVLYGDLGRFKASYMGSAAFGNPMREHGHTFPGCSYSDGEGIVTPNAHGTPAAHWDLACDKAMTGSTGDDLYTKLNKSGTSAQQNADMRAVWDIVNKANPLSLAEALLMLATHPSFGGGIAAAEAAFQALGFFVVKGTSPHVRYQFTMPIDGDPRDCWEIAREHMADLVARLPVGAAVAA